MPSFNSNTLSPEEQIEAGSQMRKDKMASGGEDQGGENQNDNQSQSLRQRMTQARRALANKQGATEKATAPARQWTSKLLQQAWLNAIDSLSLSLFWVYIHIFLSFVLGEKLFCKLGHEWIPESIKQKSPKKAKTIGDKFGIGEWVIVGIVGLIHLAIIGSIALFLFLMIHWYSLGTWEKIKELWGLGWDEIKILVNLFDLGD